MEAETRRKCSKICNRNEIKAKWKLQENPGIGTGIGKSVLYQKGRGNRVEAKSRGKFSKNL